MTKLLALALATVGIAACESKSTPPAPAPAPAAAAPATPAAPSTPTPPRGHAELVGKVLFTGKAPAPVAIDTASDPWCSRTKQFDESVVVNANKTLKNVVVRLVDVPGDWPAPSQPVVIEQDGCAYRPRVVAAVAGQTIELRNGDQTMHNVHTYKGARTLLNKAQIAGGPALEQRFTDTHAILTMKCDVHPWMRGYVSVTNHPFVAVTGDDGSFSIKDLPVGTWKVEAWQESFGTKTQTITVGPSGTVTADFRYDGTEKP